MINNELENRALLFSHQYNDNAGFDILQDQPIHSFIQVSLLELFFFTGVTLLPRIAGRDTLGLQNYTVD